jgi:hypothetical protein
MRPVACVLNERRAPSTVRRDGRVISTVHRGGIVDERLGKGQEKGWG